MKKALYTLALLTVLLLPGMGQAQERLGNGTVPPYTLWLPMVGEASLEEMYPECPYEVVLETPIEGQEVKGVTVFGWQRIPAAYGLLFEITDDPSFVNTIYRGGATLKKAPPSVHIDLSDLAPAPYYWHARYVCLRDGDKFSFGPWSSPVMFVVVP